MGVLWEIADYSRNGTFVDGKRLVSNTKTPLQVGQKIQCALLGNSIFEVIDLAPPAAMLLPLNSIASPIILNPFNCFPDEVNPEASVYLSASGLWMFDSGSISYTLKDGDEIKVFDQQWKCWLSKPMEQTSTIGGKPTVSQPVFNFLVSQNEEHTFLSLNLDGQKIDLGERIHHYSLLTLARKRIEDSRQGLDKSSQGWLGQEDLSKMLGIDPAHLNVQLFRARNQIIREGRQQNYSLEDVIERRRGELRFNAFPFRIVRGETIEAEFNCPLY